MWRRCVMYAYDPERLFARFAYQVDATFAHRLDVPARGKLTVRNLPEAVVLAFNLVLWIGLLSQSYPARAFLNPDKAEVYKSSGSASPLCAILIMRFAISSRMASSDPHSSSVDIALS
jgi:hypothetical protein